MLLSIIIPVFNTEQYIERCLSSVSNLCIEDYEIIVINDGSKDRSERIIQGFIEQHKETNVRLINQENGGLSYARNQGILAARGDYVQFLDSDDYVESSAYDFIRTELDGSVDIIEIGYRVRRQNNILRERIPPKINIKGGEKYLSVVLNNPDYEWYAWKYIVKREFLISNEMMFPVGKKYEDVYLMPRIILKAQKVKSVSKIVINYTLGRPGAITNGVNIRTEIDKINVIVDDIEYFKTVFIPDETLKKLNDNISKLYYSGMIYLYAFKGQDRRRFYSILKKSKYITIYTNTAPQVYLKRIMGIIGIKGTAMLLYMRMIINDKRKRK